MYFGIPTAGTSPAKYQDEDRVLLPLSPPPAPSKMPPELSIYGLFSSERYREAWGRRVEVLKKRRPKNPFYSVALEREKLPPPPNLSAEATFVSFEGGRIKREKKNALGGRWGSDKGRHKKGAGDCVQVLGSHWSADSDPLRGRDSGSVLVGLGTEAAAASESGPVRESSKLCSAGRSRWAASKPARTGSPHALPWLQPLEFHFNGAEGDTLPRPPRSPAEAPPNRAEQGGQSASPLPLPLYPASVY